MENKKNTSIAVLLSGGVDSSVALSILNEKNYNIEAFYLKIWLEDELSYLGNCPWEEDISYAKSICDQLKIKLNILSMQKVYWENVVEYTINQIKHGNTPNPDMLCNKFVKMGVFFDQIGKNYDFIATGHYAKNIYIDNKIYLGCVEDKIKDQTYFLSYTNKEKIYKTLFPLGEFNNKHSVRQYAETKKLLTAKRADSQGICFLGKIEFKKFVEYYCGKKIGNIIEIETGKKIAEHNGFWFYTIGQRKGIGLSGGPWFVIDKNPYENIIFVSKICPKNKKETDIFTIKNINWLVEENEIPKNNSEIKLKLRHGPNFNKGEIININFNEDYKIKLFEKDQGIANGQFAALYTEDEKICIGSGIMNKNYE
jgi:tRNA (5-methylaminomethyl-2-thiouridylate)-methyltransferase